MSPAPQAHSQRPPGNRPNAGHGQAAPRIDTSRIRLGDEIDPQLYADIAQAVANEIACSGRNDRNKGTQLRRFYDELCLWNEKINGTGMAEERAQRFATLAPLVKMLKAKVAYAKGRGHVDENFETLFCHLIDQVKDAPTLEQAKLFMEAFMGFYKATPKG